MDNIIDDEYKIIVKALKDFYYNCHKRCLDSEKCFVDDEYRQMSDKLESFLSYVQSISAEREQLKAIYMAESRLNSLQKDLEQKKLELGKLLEQQNPFENKIFVKNDKEVASAPYIFQQPANANVSEMLINGEPVEPLNLNKHNLYARQNQYEEATKEEAESNALVSDEIITKLVEKFNGDEAYAGQKIIISDEDIKNRDRRPQRFTSFSESQKLIFVESNNFARFFLRKLQEYDNLYVVFPQRHLKITRADVLFYAFEDVFVLDGYKDMQKHDFILEKPAIFERIEEGKYKLLVRGKLKLQPIEE